MASPTCRTCMAIVKSSGDTCSLCRRFGRVGEPLTGGRWVLVGNTQRWIEDDFS